MMKINSETIIKILKFLKKIVINFWKKVLLKAIEFVRYFIMKKSTCQFKLQMDASESDSVINTLPVEHTGNRNGVRDAASEITAVVAVEIIPDENEDKGKDAMVMSPSNECNAVVGADDRNEENIKNGSEKDCEYENAYESKTSLSVSVSEDERMHVEGESSSEIENENDRKQNSTETVEVEDDNNDHDEMSQQNLNVSSAHEASYSENMIRNENEHACASAHETAKEGDENSNDEFMSNSVINVDVNVDVDVDIIHDEIVDEDKNSFNIISSSSPNDHNSVVENNDENNDENSDERNDENVSESNDENIDENNDESTDENVSVNDDESIDENNDVNVFENNDENIDENNDESTNENVSEKDDENDDKIIEENISENDDENNNVNVFENNDENSSHASPEILFENISHNTSQTPPQLPAPILFENISDKTSETLSIVTAEDNKSEVSLKNASSFSTENNFECNFESNFENDSSSSSNASNASNASDVPPLNAFDVSSPNASAISSETTVSETSNAIPNVSLPQAGNSCSNGITVRHQISLSNHSLSPPNSSSSSSSVLSNIAMDETVELLAIHETVERDDKMEMEMSRIDNSAEELKYWKAVSAFLGEKMKKKGLLKKESKDSEQNGKEEASKSLRNKTEKKDDCIIIKNKDMEMQTTSSKSIHLNTLYHENGRNSMNKINCSDSSTQNEQCNYSIPIHHSSSINNQRHYPRNNTNKTHSNHRKHPNHPKSSHGFNSQRFQINQAMRTQQNSHGYHHPSPPTPLPHRLNANASSYTPHHLVNVTNCFPPFNMTNPPPLSAPLHLPLHPSGQAVVPLLNPNQPIQNVQNYLNYQIQNMQSVQNYANIQNVWNGH